MFRLLLLDKGESGFSVDRPDQFLSAKAIERRNKQDILVDETDLPVAESYLSRIRHTGVEIVAKSKWLKTVTVKTNDTSVANTLLALPFVDTLQCVYRGVLAPVEEDTLPLTPFEVTGDETYQDKYGKGFQQIALHNGNLLHAEGYQGQGMTIAVFDGGFQNVDKMDAFLPERILERKSFTYIQTDPFRVKSRHGTRVLSCMLANKENVMVGTAPEASYYLFCSEVDNCEFPVEEDFWMTGVEYADSVGVDIITTSLGYTTFDAEEMNHAINQLDGETILMSRAATMATEKGIFVLNAAGNEGNQSWQTISFPSDAKGILTVGAVDSDGYLADFTPYGPTVDGRTKPDVVGMGVATSLIDVDGSLISGNGTSFSTPVVAGLVACLWQALPELNVQQLVQLLQNSSDRYDDPDPRYGYGIPDVFKIYGENTSLKAPWHTEASSPLRHIGAYLFVNVEPDFLPKCKLSVYSTIGERVVEVKSLPHASIGISHLPKGMYIALLEGPNIYRTCKFITR